MDGTFRKYLEEAIGPERAAIAFSALSQPASVSVRWNPLKTPFQYTFPEGDRLGESLRTAFPEGERVPWSPHGRILASRPVFTLDPLFHAGSYYVQDSSSMFVGEVFRAVLSSVAGTPKPLRVLDLCAAPGGKTTDLAASLREFAGFGSILVANEVMKDRVGVLADNVAVWGMPEVVVTNSDPAAFSSLTGVFDIILTDVPCSGEGMFRKDPEAVRQWSADNVALCQARQRRILADVWPALADGGMLIYSTCTFNRMENDDNVEWMCSELGAESTRPGALEKYEADGVFPTRYGYSLVPGFVSGEGQYCAVVRKVSGDAPAPKAADQQTRTRKAAASTARASASAASRASASADISKYFSSLREMDDRRSPLREMGTGRDWMDKRQIGDVTVALPAFVTPFLDSVSSLLRVVRCGCTVGTLKGRDIVPSEDLVYCTEFNPDVFDRVEVDRTTALNYLHGDALRLGGLPAGYLVLDYEGRHIGLVKNIGSRCNNLRPSGRRIRMDVTEALKREQA